MKEILVKWCKENHSNYIFEDRGAYPKEYCPRSVCMHNDSNCTNLHTSQSKELVLTCGRRFVIASIPQFQKNGAVPNLALTVGTPRISWVLLTSGKFLKTMYWSGFLISEESKYIGIIKSICCRTYIISYIILLLLNHGLWVIWLPTPPYKNELTIDKHLFCQSLFQSQYWAFHYMASVWSFLLVEHSSTII